MQNNEENRNVGENIRLYRIRAGLTVKELSKRIHRHHQLVIKPGSIRNYEKGTEKILPPQPDFFTFRASQFYKPSKVSSEFGLQTVIGWVMRHSTAY